VFDSRDDFENIDVNLQIIMDNFCTTRFGGSGYLVEPASREFIYYYHHYTDVADRIPTHGLEEEEFYH